MLATARPGQRDPYPYREALLGVPLAALDSTLLTRKVAPTASTTPTSTTMSKRATAPSLERSRFVYWTVT
jgi:hypothetical protein